MKNETSAKTYRVVTEADSFGIEAIDIVTNDDGTLDFVDESGNLLATFSCGSWKYAYLQGALK